MFSQIEKDMNSFMDFELSKTSAVLLFMVICLVAYLFFRSIGVLVLLGIELYRYGKGCCYEEIRL